MIWYTENDSEWKRTVTTHHVLLNTFHVYIFLIFLLGKLIWFVSLLYQSTLREASDIKMDLNGIS